MSSLTSSPHTFSALGLGRPRAQAVLASPQTWLCSSGTSSLVSAGTAPTKTPLAPAQAQPPLSCISTPPRFSSPSLPTLGCTPTPFPARLQAASTSAWATILTSLLSVFTPTAELCRWGVVTKSLSPSQLDTQHGWQQSSL